MQFHLGIYNYFSAGALECLLSLIYSSKFPLQHPIDQIANINITTYNTAFGVMRNPANWYPRTRQEAIHSTVYTLSTMLIKAYEVVARGVDIQSLKSLDELWKALMMEPNDYAVGAVGNLMTQTVMGKCTISHGGQEYDEKSLEGMPTSLRITFITGATIESGLVVFPSGHIKNSSANIKDIMSYKNLLLGKMALSSPKELSEKLFMLNYL
jgi:2-methylcitrate dehydratase